MTRCGQTRSGKYVGVEVGMDDYHATQCLRDVFGDDFVADEIDSTTHIPPHEFTSNVDQVEPSNCPGGNKRKHNTKFVRRLDIALSAHEAAHPTVRNRNDVDTIQSKRVRTMYMHRNGQQRDEIQHNDPNSSQASATSFKRKKGQRGKYRTLALEKKTMGGLLKLDIQIPEFVLQAVGENARDIVNFCGYVVRTTAFMTAGSWSSVFAVHGDSMWLQFKNKFKIKDSCTQLLRLQAFATDTMQRLYRYWKHRLHTYYKECGDTFEERKENPPEDFPKTNWEACCLAFESDKFKKRSIQNSKNRGSDKWIKHTTGNLSFPEVEYVLTKKNNDVLPPSDIVWLTEHTTINDNGKLEWVNDNRSKEIHTQLHQLVQDKDKEPEQGQVRPQTQEEMLLHVLGPKSGYTRGKGNGYGGSAKARLQEQQLQTLHEQQNQISLLQNQLEASVKGMEEYKAQQQITMADMEKRFMAMLAKTIRLDDYQESS